MAVIEHESIKQQTPPRRLPLLGDTGTPISRPGLLACAYILDFAAVSGAGILAALVMAPAAPQSPIWLAVFVLAIAGGVVATMQARWAYTIAALRRPPSQALTTVASLLLVFAAATAMAYLTGMPAAWRGWFALWLSGSAVALVALRLGWAPLIDRWAAEGRLVRRTVIVGGGTEARDLIDRIGASRDHHIALLGVFDDRAEPRARIEPTGCRNLGTFAELESFCRSEKVDLLIVALPHSAEDRLAGILRKLWTLPVDVRLSALGTRLRFARDVYTQVGGVPTLPVFRKSLSDWDTLVKSVEDKVIASLMLLLAAPIMALIAIAIKLDSNGPVLFRQRRYGFNNELIEVFKFRSLKVEQEDANAAKLVVKGDPRVTRVGRIIRKTGLDELPQIFNVLRGDMSIVGPRPHATQAKAAGELYQSAVDGYYARHRMKPGITGWAQINGWRGETDTVEKIQQRVTFDLEYIDNWSLAFDLAIIAMTPMVLLRMSEAH